MEQPMELMPTMLRLLPHRANARTEITLPSIKKSVTDTLLPARTKLRVDNELPILTKFIVDT
jgi:hypothetical protein